MKVTITHFKCYYNTTTYDFPAFKLSLLSSPSGSGKTTIFTSIMWCLYGSVQKIKPNKSNSTKETRVMIELPEFQNLKIIRSSSKFEVILNNGNILTFDSAQGYIDSIFGNKTLWISSSYMAQKELNPIMTLPNVDRFKLLHELTYGVDAELEINNPDFYLNKCDNLISTVKTTSNIETGKFNVMKENYCQLFNSNIDIINSWPQHLALDQLSNLIKQKEDLVLKNIELNNKLIIVRDIESKILTINNMLILLNDKLLLINYRPIDEIQKDLNKYEAQNILLKKIYLIESLNKQLIDLGDIPENYIERLPKAQEELNLILNFNNSCMNEGITPDQLNNEILRLEEDIKADDIYNNWKNEMEIWKMEYDKQFKIIEELWIIECNTTQNKYNLELERKKEIENNNFQLMNEYNKKCENKNKSIIEYEKIKKLYEQEQKNKNEYEIISNNYETCKQWWNSNFKSELNNINIENKIHEFNMLLEELICPHCNNGVTYSNKSLFKGHSDFNARELAKNQITNITNIHNICKYYHEYKNIENITLPNPPSPGNYSLPELIEIPIHSGLILPKKAKVEIRPQPIEPRKINNNSRMRYLKLKSLNQPNYDIDKLRKEITVLNKGYECCRIKTQLNALGVINEKINENEILMKITELEKELSTAQQKQSDKNSILNSINDLQNSIPFKPEKSSEILNSELNSNNNKIIDLDKYIKAGNLIIKLTQDRQNVESMHNYLLQLSTYQNNIDKIKQIINEVSSSSLEDTVKNITSITNLILKEIFDDDIAISLNTHKELKNAKIKLQVNIQIYYQNTIYSDPSEISGGEQDRISIALTLAIAKLSNSPLILLDESFKFIDENLKEKCLEVIKTHFCNKTVIHVSNECVKGVHHEVFG